jgi:hypothetical protein
MLKTDSPDCAILQLRFRLRVPPEMVLAHAREAAEKIASADGMIWKIWVVEQERREIGGVYLFASREAALAYLNHPIIESLCSNPAVVAIDSQIWEVENKLSTITRGPLENVRMKEQEIVMAGGR